MLTKTEKKKSIVLVWILNMILPGLGVGYLYAVGVGALGIRTLSPLFLVYLMQGIWHCRAVSVASYFALSILGTVYIVMRNLSVGVDDRQLKPAATDDEQKLVGAVKPQEPSPVGVDAPDSDNTHFALDTLELKAREAQRRLEERRAESQDRDDEEAANFGQTGIADELQNAEVAWIKSSGLEVSMSPKAGSTPPAAVSAAEAEDTDKEVVLRADKSEPATFAGTGDTSSAFESAVETWAQQSRAKVDSMTSTAGAAPIVDSAEPAPPSAQQPGLPVPETNTPSVAYDLPKLEGQTAASTSALPGLIDTALSDKAQDVSVPPTTPSTPAATPAVCRKCGASRVETFSFCLNCLTDFSKV